MLNAGSQALEPSPDDGGGEGAPLSPEAEAKIEALKAAVTTTVLRRIKDAIEARQASGIDDIWDEDQDQYDGIDELSAEEANGRARQQQAQDTGTNRRAKSRLYLNITKPKTDAAVARVSEMLVPTDARPWEFKPTPIPELLEVIEAEDQTQLTLGDGTQASAHDVARTEVEKARKACDKAMDWVEDQFVEGDVYAQMRSVIRDAGRLGTGVLKGPFPVTREVKKWTRKGPLAMLEVARKTAPTSKRKDIRDVFPDPACGESIHDGSFFVERDFCTARQLRDMAKVMREDGSPEYDRDAIVLALKEGPNNRGRDRGRNHRDRAGEQREGEVYVLYHYYGDIDPATLISLGCNTAAMGEEDIYLQAMPAIVTMLNDRPIKAALNPLETGGFPFDFFPWEVVDGQPWGRGVPRKMRAAQKMLVAAVRAMLRNAGLSAGAQVVLNGKCIKPAPGQRYALQGDMLWEFTPDERVQKVQDAFAVFTITSAQQQLQAIIDFARAMADELTNLPLLLQGQQGSAPELLGGMQMLMQNATAPLRVIAKQFDDYLISSHLRRYYDWCMQNGPEEAKGDAMVQPLGSTALIAREIAREALLTRLPAMAQQPNSRIDPAKVEAEALRSLGIPVESITYSDEEWKRVQEAKQKNPPPGPPQIEVAKIREQGMKERHELDMQNNEAQRATDEMIARLEFQVQAMELANRENVSLNDLKAMLAAEAMKSRDKRELFAAEQALKLSPANPTNQGI